MGTGLGRAVFRLMCPQVNQHPPCGSRPLRDLFIAQRNSLPLKGIPYYTKGFLITQKELLATQRNSLLHKGIPSYTKGSLTAQRVSLLFKRVPYYTLENWRKPWEIIGNPGKPKKEQRNSREPPWTKKLDFLRKAVPYFR